MIRPGCSCAADGFQNLRNRERLEFRLVLDEDCPVGTHRQGGPQGLLRRGGTDGDGDDLRHVALFLLPYSLFDRDFVKRIDRHFDVGEIDSGPVRLDPNGHIEIDHPLDGDEDLHGARMPCLGWIRGAPQGAQVYCAVQ